MCEIYHAVFKMIIYPSKKPSMVPSVPFPSVPLPSPSSRFLHWLYINWGTTFFQQLWKCYIWLRPYRRGLRFGTYLGWNFRFGLRSRGQNISKLLFFYTNAQIGSIRSCSNGLKLGMNIGLYMGHMAKKIWWSLTQKKGLLGSKKSSSIVTSSFSHFWASRSPLRQKWHIPNCS